MNDSLPLRIPLLSTATGSQMGAAWEEFNSEESWLPLVLPLTIWAGTFLLCYGPANKYDRDSFHQWSAVHTCHNVGLIALGATSIYYNNDAVFNERIPILWATGYFLIDFLDCMARRDWEYTIHAAFGLAFNFFAYTTPVLRLARLISMGAALELSSPLLHLAKKTRKPRHFAAFTVVYTLCRIVWIPYIMYKMRLHGLRWWDLPMVAVFCFYCLNLWWWYKILRIFWRGVLGISSDEDKKRNH